MTKVGVENAYAQLIADAEQGGSRDDVAAMTIRKQVLKEFVELQKQEDIERRHQELLKAHTDTQALLNRQQGGGNTSFDSEGLQLPSRANGEPASH